MSSAINSFIPFWLPLSGELAREAGLISGKETGEKENGRKGNGSFLGEERPIGGGEETWGGKTTPRCYLTRLMPRTAIAAIAAMAIAVGNTRL